MSNYKPLLYPLIIIFLLGGLFTYFSPILANQGAISLTAQLFITTVEIILKTLSALIYTVLFVIQLIPNAIISFISSVGNFPNFNPFTALWNNILSAVNFIFGTSFGLVGNVETELALFEFAEISGEYFNEIIFKIVNALELMAFNIPSIIFDPLIIIMSISLIWGSVKLFLP